MPRKGSPGSATTPLAECSCPLPWNCPGATFAPDHRYHQCRPAAEAGLARMATPAYGSRRGFFWARRAPGPFDSQGRGGIESARLPLCWDLIAVRSGGHVEWKGRARWDGSEPASRSSPGSDAFTWGPLYAGQHACLARFGRLDLPELRVPRALGSSEREVEMSTGSAQIHAGKTRQRRLLASALLTSSMLVVLLVAVAPPAFAVTDCTHSGTIDTIEFDDDATPFTAGTTCGDVSNTTLIAVTGSTGNDTFVIDLSGGAFPAAINFQVDLLGGTDTLTINGSTGADTIEFGADGVDLDNDDAEDVTDPTPPGAPAGVENSTVNAAAGNDTVTGWGSTGLGSAFTSALTLNGDAGTDTIGGGSGADTLNGGADTDTLTYA